jgi:hypothetical protein
MWDRMDPTAWPGAYHLTFTARVAPGSPVPRVRLQLLPSTASSSVGCGLWAACAETASPAFCAPFPPVCPAAASAGGPGAGAAVHAGSDAEPE